MLPELDKPHVHMKDSNRVFDIIRNMINSGKERLQVVSDFDMTLSRFSDDNGQICESCYCALDSSPLLPETYRCAALSLKDVYYQIEIDPKMSVEEKCPHMVEWWMKAHDLLLQCDFKQSYLEQIVRSSRIFLRKDCDWLFNELNVNNVPLLVFSAGIGDVIVEVLRQRAVFHDNMKVVSNFMDFNEQGLLTGFKGELLHVFNKNENAVHQSDYFEALVHRDSIILMGDSIGDLSMANGAAECTNVLNIGFLNDKVEERLSSYIEAYDIVIVNDQTLDVPNAIIRQILYPQIDENNVGKQTQENELVAQQTQETSCTLADSQTPSLRT